MRDNNYYPQRPKNTIDIPDFLTNKNEPEDPMMEQTSQIAMGIQAAVEIGAEEKRNNMYHLKELDRATDAYSEEEAKVVIKRLVSNYPDLVLGEVASLIKDMQDLSGIILQNSKIFANKRGEI